MYIAVDGSYCDILPERISAGVVIADSCGFFETHHYEERHIEANSTFSEWFALEKGIELALERAIKEPIEQIVFFSDYVSIVDTLEQAVGFNQASDVPYRNEFLRRYVYRIHMLLNDMKSQYFTRYKKELLIEIEYVKGDFQPEFIKRLHKMAHNEAQMDGIEKCSENNKNKKKSKKNKAKVTKPKEVEINVALKAIEKGNRKWFIYENGKEMYVGKLREIINQYNKERYNITKLANENKLKVNKKTKRTLEKTIPQLVIR